MAHQEGLEGRQDSLGGHLEDRLENRLESHLGDLLESRRGRLHKEDPAGCHFPATDHHHRCIHQDQYRESQGLR